MGMVGQVSGNLGNLTAANTSYTQTQSGHTGTGWITEVRTKQVMPVAGTFDYFRVQLLTAPGAGNSRQFTIRKTAGAGTGAGAGTALTTTISDTNTSNQDLSNNFSVSAGDCIGLEQVTSATVTTSNNTAWVLRFTAANNNEYPLLWGNNATTGAGATEYGPIQGNNPSGATEATTEAIMPTSGTLSNMYVDLDGIATTSTFVVSLRVNGADASPLLSASVAATASTANDTSNTVSVSAGDRVCVKIVNNGIVARRVRVGIKFSPTTDGESILLHSAGQTVAQNLTRYNDPSSSATWTATENVRQFPVIACTLKNLYGRISGPIANAQTFIGSLNNNTSATGVTVTFTGDGTNPITGSDTSHTANLSDDNLISVKGVTSATSGTVTPAMGFVLYIAPAAGSIAARIYDFFSFFF